MDAYCHVQLNTDGGSFDALSALMQLDGSVLLAHQEQPVCAQHALSVVYVRQSVRELLPHTNTLGGSFEDVAQSWQLDGTAAQRHLQGGRRGGGG
jgi:hypothetical protein